MNLNLSATDNKKSDKNLGNESALVSIFSGLFES